MRPTGPTHNQIKHAHYDKRIHWFVAEASEVSYVDNELKSKWRSAAIRFVHSTNTQFILGFLLLLDVVFLFTQVFLDASFPPCYAILDHASCVNSSGAAGSNVVQCIARPAAVDVAMQALYLGSVSILIVFEVELTLLFLTLGIQFFRNCGYYLDFTIVTVSLVLEIVLHSSEDSSAASAVIFARIWRLIRIGHGIFAGKRRQLIIGMLNDEELPDHEVWEESSNEDDGSGSGSTRTSRRASATKTDRTKDQSRKSRAGSGPAEPPQGRRSVQHAPVAPASPDGDAPPRRASLDLETADLATPPPNL